jgi:hypothetical protein
MKGKMPSYFSLLLSTSEVGLGGIKTRSYLGKLLNVFFKIIFLNFDPRLLRELLEISKLRTQEDPLPF